MVFKIWLGGCPEQIAAYWTKLGHTRNTNENVKPNIARLGSNAQIEFALKHGMDLHRLKYLRIAMRQWKWPIALLKHYPQWPLTRQDRKHLRHRMLQWPEKERARIVNPFWLDLIKS